MATDTAPSPNFSGIDFNPDFFSTSTSLTLSEEDTLYLNKSVADTANVLETFTVGISANALQATTASITSTLQVMGELSTDFLDSVGTTLTLGNGTATSVRTALPFYANSYYLTGTAPTLSKASMNYFVNYGSVSTGYTTTGSRYLYTPTTNSSTSNSNYFQAGIYEAIIHVYVVQTGGPTFSGCAFTLGVASGTVVSASAISTSAQYGGTMLVPSTSFTTGNAGGVNLNFLGAVFSHTACFTLASSAFINLELFVSTLTSIIDGTVNFSVFGCVKRIA